MKDTYDFTYAGDLRHFIGVLLDDYCPTQLKIFDSDIVYDVIKDLKQFDVELTGDQIFEDCCLECNALLNKDLQQLKEDFSYTDMEELSEYEKETVKEFLDAYNGNLSVGGILKWQNEEHWFWQCEECKDLIVYKNWVVDPFKKGE